MYKEITRKDWIAKYRNLFIEKGVNPHDAETLAGKYVKCLEKVAKHIIEGDAKEEPVGLLSEVR